MKGLFRVFGGLMIGIALVCSAVSEEAARLDHRDDFKMNFIGGGDFRRYVSEVVVEDDLWAHSVRTLGIFHNLMHEWMSDLALHDAEEMGNRERVPEFGARISGGDWTEYRKVLEKPNEPSSWRDLVRIVEVMHDRVHHAMYQAAVYDSVSHKRDVDLNNYLRDDKRFPTAETLPPREELTMESISPANFRALVWNHRFDDPRLHAAMQKIAVFDHLLYDLMTQWARHGDNKKEAVCQPPDFDVRITGVQWSSYAIKVRECEDHEWRDLVRVTALMHERIRHVMHQLVLHVADGHEREEEIRGLLRNDGP